MTAWMVVEDEPDLYEMLMTISQILGIDGVAFTDGEDATAWIDTVDAGSYLGDLPQLALLDIRLPGEIDGPAVGARLRQSPVLGDIPIILMTAYRLSPEQEVVVKRTAGTDTLLYKPLPDLETLRRMIRDLTSQ